MTSTSVLKNLRVLVGVSQIAEFTRVKPAVVTNWRSRFDTFPSPTVPGPRPQFDLAKVLDWLDSGQGPSGRPAPELDPETWWKFAVKAFLVEPTIASPRQTLASLLVVHHRLAPAEYAVLVDDRVASANGLSVARALTSVAHAAEAEHPELRGLLVPVLADLDDHVALLVLDMIRVLHLERWSYGPLDQLEVVLADLDVSARPAESTASDLAHVMAALAAAQPGDVVFDPACGEGSALVACAQSVDGEIELCGQEMEASVLQIARTRLLLARLDTSGLAPWGADSLRDDQFPDLRADVVILDPPVRVATAPLDRWLRHAVRHCAPDGRVVMSLPLSAVVEVKAARRGVDKELRNQLDGVTRERRVHAAVVLPRGQRADVVGPMVVMVIGGDESRLGDDERPVVAFVETRTEKGFEPHLIPEIASAVRVHGLAGLMSLQSWLVSAEFVDDGNDLWDVIDRVGQHAEEGNTRGRRSTTRQRTPINEFLDTPALSVDRLFVRSGVDSQMPALRSTTSSSADEPLSLGQLRSDVADLVARLEEQRSLIGDAVYEHFAEALERVKRHL